MEVGAGLGVLATRHQSLATFLLDTYRDNKTRDTSSGSSKQPHLGAVFKIEHPVGIRLLTVLTLDTDLAALNGLITYCPRTDDDWIRHD